MALDIKNLLVQDSVGIGNNSPAQKLEVSASDNQTHIRTSLASQPSSYYLDLKTTVTPSNVRWNFSMVNAGTAYNDVLVFNSGNVGIGTTGPTEKLDVVGNIAVSGTVDGVDIAALSSTALTTSTSFGGDVSGTYNAIVIADDSHNHIISNVDGLQTALDAKAADNAVVKLTGAQTVGGVKTFSNSFTGSGTNNASVIETTLNNGAIVGPISATGLYIDAAGTDVTNHSMTGIFVEVAGGSDNSVMQGYGLDGISLSNTIASPGKWLKIKPIAGSNAGTTIQTNSSTSSNITLTLPSASGTLVTDSHSHGDINALGTITSTAVSPENGDYIIISDANNATANTLKRGIAVGTSTTTFLRNDGTWATPAGSGVSGSGTTNEITYWSGSSTIASLSTATYPSLTELSRVKGVTSAIQTQIDGKAPTSHATSATTYGVGTNTNYGHVKGLRLTGASDGESGVVVVSGVAYATKTLRTSGTAQQAWATLLDLDTTEGNILRFVDLTITRTEGSPTSITYYIGSIMIDVNGLATSATNPSPVTTATRWRLSSHNSSNTQVTLPIYIYRNTGDNTLRAYVDQATTATYDYECVGYY